MRKTTAAGISGEPVSALGTCRNMRRRIVRGNTPAANVPRIGRGRAPSPSLRRRPEQVVQAVAGLELDPGNLFGALGEGVAQAVEQLVGADDGAALGGDALERLHVGAVHPQVDRAQRLAFEV